MCSRKELLQLKQRDCLRLLSGSIPLLPGEKLTISLEIVNKNDAAYDVKDVPIDDFFTESRWKKSGVDVSLRNDAITAFKHLRQSYGSSRRPRVAMTVGDVCLAVFNKNGASAARIRSVLVNAVTQVLAYEGISL